MSITHESAFEANIEAHLLAHGWGKVAPAGYDRKLGLFPDEVIAFVKGSQPKAWAQLVSRHGGEASARQKFLKVVADALDHRGVISVLRSAVKDTGVTVRLCFFKPASTRNAEQSQRYAANRLGVVRQLHHSESHPADSLDLTLVVNGIPVATAELKNPLTGQGLEQAMVQYRTDRNPHDLIFTKRALVHFAVDPHRVAMTTRLAGQDTVFLPFDMGSAGPGRPRTAGNPAAPGYQTAYLWQEVWQRDAWLDLLGSFIHVEDGRVLFPRFHQWHAVRSILDATYRDGAGVDRLVQHSAGSGKSNTIAWTAHSLSRLHGADDEPIFDKVVVITDRKVLDRQLQETVSGLEHTPGTIVRIDEKSQQLKEALEGNAARVIITTLQKFPVVAELAAKAAAEGEAKGVVGRTGSPSSSTRRTPRPAGTRSSKAEEGPHRGDEALAEAEAAESAAEAASSRTRCCWPVRAPGQEEEPVVLRVHRDPETQDAGDVRAELDGQHGHKRPFHTYSMRQAIAEGFILDVLANYTTYGVYYKLANASPAQRPRDGVRKGRAALARFASLHPYQLDAKAEVIVEHFRQKTAGKIDGTPRRWSSPAPGCTRCGPSRPRTRTSRARATRPRRARCGPWWRSPGPWSTRTPRRAAVDRGRHQRVLREAAAEAVPWGGLPGARRGREVPDRVRRAAAAHDVRRQEARRRQGGADPVPAQPHHPGKRTRSCSTSPTRRGDPGRVRAVLRGVVRHPHRAQRALRHGARPDGRRGAVHARRWRPASRHCCRTTRRSRRCCTPTSTRRSGGSSPRTRTRRRSSAAPCRASAGRTRSSPRSCRSPTPTSNGSSCTGDSCCSTCRPGRTTPCRSSASRCSSPTCASPSPPRPPSSSPAPTSPAPRCLARARAPVSEPVLDKLSALIAAMNEQVRRRPRRSRQGLGRPAVDRGHG
jgi:hypothetical protein